MNHSHYVYVLGTRSFCEDCDESVNYGSVVAATEAAAAHKKATALQAVACDIKDVPVVDVSRTKLRHVVLNCVEDYVRTTGGRFLPANYRQMFSSNARALRDIMASGLIKSVPQDDPHADRPMRRTAAGDALLVHWDERYGRTSS